MIKYSWTYPLLFGDTYWIKKQWAVDILKDMVAQEIRWCNENPPEQYGVPHPDIASEYYVKGLR